MRTLPYWRLSSFYFFYFAFVGAISPYWGLYLQSLRFAAFQIGVLMSLLQFMRIFAPNIWGHWADRRGRRIPIVQLAALGSALAFCGVFLDQSFWWLFAVMAAMSFFWSASLPLVEATTLSHLGEHIHRYGRIRLWGSVGFILAVLGLGYAQDLLGIAWLPWAVLALLAGTALFARWIPEADIGVHATDQHTVATVLRQKPVWGLLLACFFMAAAHGPYYTFYTIYLVDGGYSPSQVGWLWAVGVICEIAVFFWLPRLRDPTLLYRLLIGSLLVAALRFLMIAWLADSGVIMFVAQTLHAATFGVYHASALALIHHYFRGRHQGRGQGLYSSLSYGAGGTVGSLYAGWAWQGLGGHWTFTLAAGCALFAAAVAYYSRPFKGAAAA